MDEDDHDELLQCTDDESMSESEDQCVPIAKSEQKAYSINSHSVYSFAFTKLALLLSSAFLIILFPLYFEAVNAKGDSFTGLLFSSTTVFLILFIACVIAKLFVAKYNVIKIWKLPLRLVDLTKLCVVYTISGFIVVYALDRKRVLCHLQDPIKGTILVFSLFYYFLFCKKRK